MSRLDEVARLRAELVQLESERLIRQHLPITVSAIDRQRMMRNAYPGADYVEPVLPVAVVRRPWWKFWVR